MSAHPTTCNKMYIFEDVYRSDCIWTAQLRGLKVVFYGVLTFFFNQYQLSTLVLVIYKLVNLFLYSLNSELDIESGESVRKR